ncbi:SDR family NAD(P)-dependent oxidoreductase [Altericroceibacterium xinjiangense]|uniref:SDR family NAD(P)-dependent oxidoreductase n=1 Tax=Altericroceibacterium xinjiangense TaxID=762261 RepID=UPI000F7E0A42|nr:SDR family NAD(P)-dependent oxidoreductase [Altericroceibacterium xinjiangense]
MDPAGKQAVVTGGNSGLGQATVEALVAVGANVVSLDRSGTAPKGARHIVCDVTDESSVKAAVDQIEGGIHILVNSAGIGGMGPIASAEGPGDLAAFRQVIDVNLTGAVTVAAHVAHRMIGNAPSGEDEERGVIVNACSIASYEGQEGMSAYTASKAALAALTLVWARDLSRHGIRVMGVAPGFMTTPLVSGLPDDFVAELLKGAEFPKRAGRAREFADVVQFIVSTPLLNGEVIRLDAATRPPARTLWSAG